MKELTISMQERMDKINFSDWIYSDLEKLTIKKVKNIPENIGVLKNLKCLEIYCNNLLELPSSLTSLLQLEYLKIFSTKLESILWKINGLMNLKILDLEWCFLLKKLPTDICEMKNLEKLILKWCSSITELPNWIDKLQALCLVDISWWLSSQWPKLETLIPWLIEKSINFELKWWDRFFNKHSSIDYSSRKLITSGKNFKKLDISTLSEEQLYSEITSWKKKILIEKCFIEYKKKYSKEITLVDWDKIFLNWKSLFNFSQLKSRLTSYNISLTKDIINANYILIWTNPTLDYKELVWSKVIFDENLDELFEKKGEYYIQSNDTIDLDLLNDLLLSDDTSNVQIGINLLKEWWINQKIITEIFVCYQSIKNNKLRKELWELLKINVSPELLSKMIWNYWVNHIKNIDTLLLKWFDFAKDTELDCEKYLRGILSIKWIDDKSVLNNFLEKYREY